MSGISQTAMAKGSHATFSGYPQVCTVCGQKVKMTGTDPLWFESADDQIMRSYHFDCYPRLAKVPTL